MKCYFGGAVDPFEHEFVSVCFAASAQEAKKIIWDFGDVCDDCGDEYIEMRVMRKPGHDSFFGADGRHDAHVIRDTVLLRKIGWMIDGDSRCDSCELSTMDGDFPLCPECDQCDECGHDDECEA